MVQTTTQISACDAVIELQAFEGDMRDISGSSNAVTSRYLQPTGQLRTFGSRFYVRQQCGKDAELDLRLVYTTDDDEALNILRDWFFNHPGTSRTFKVYAPAKVAGDDLYTFTVFLENLEIPLESGSADPVLCSASLRPTGEFTWAKYGS